jgi:CBS-domain-containing membrane protein
VKLKREVKRVKVKDLMTTDVKCCAEYNTLNTAAQMMWDYDIGCLPVIDKEGRAIGILTDRDVCMSAYIQGVPLTAALVTSAMSKEVFFCTPELDLAAAEKLMREKQIHRLLVLDTERHSVGLISLNDIAREGAREAEMKAARQVSDAEISGLLASICAPRHRIIQAQAA